MSKHGHLEEISFKFTEIRKASFVSAISINNVVAGQIDLHGTFTERRAPADVGSPWKTISKLKLTFV
jgi:hypothetical protein